MWLPYEQVRRDAYPTTRKDRSDPGSTKEPGRPGQVTYCGFVVRVVVNGSEHAVESPSGPRLLDVLRDDLRLTGAKPGCGVGSCGACTVLLDGSAVRACTVPVGDLEGRSVTTVEALVADGRLHPVQLAFVDARALQCGYCTPGTVMGVVSMLGTDPSPTEGAAVAALAGNVCRCGTYPRILEAIRALTSTSLRADSAADNVAVRPPTEEDVPHESVWTWVLGRLDAPGARRRWGWSTPGGARLTIDGDGRVTAYTGKVDGGQGNRVALARLVAATLDVPTSAVRVVMGDTASTPEDLGTFGSRSVPDAGHALRVVAAAARRSLRAEAVRRWHASSDEVRDGGGAVRDRAGREASYGELVSRGSTTIHVDPDDALALTAPQLVAPPMPDPDVERLVAAVTGATRFVSDLALPGMLHGVLLHPPSYGATLVSVDTSAARDRPGTTVVEAGDVVAVAASTKRGAEAELASIVAEWHEVPQPAESDLEQHLRSHPRASEGWGGAVLRETGDVEDAWARADIRLEATYTTAYIAHVPMEARAALAHVEPGAATVWVGTQRPFAVRFEVAAALRVPEESVRVVVPPFGDGFGGKHAGEVAVAAALLARAAARPVRVAWTREEEFRWAYLRPAAVIDVRAGARADGTWTSWEHTDVNAGEVGLSTPYDVPHQRIAFRPAESPLPQGSYRALAATANNFARESHLDELAVALDVDPLDLRLEHLTDARLRDALHALADRVGWRERDPSARHALGLACGLEKDARVATAAQIEVDEHGLLRILRLTTVFDCGAVVDPDGLRNQIVGATVMGLGGALFKAVHFHDGRILNPSLADYRVPRFSDVPPIDVIVLDHPDIEPAGAGETPIITVAPAIANAVRAATGRRLGHLPLVPDGHVR